MLFPSGLSRRSFLRIAGAAAISSPVITEAHLAWAQVGRRTPLNLPPGAVLINANENPMGPSQAACEAIANAAHGGGRYDFARTVELVKVFSEQQDLKSGYMSVYAGSSEPLHYAVLAFTSPEKSYVTADPGYESGIFAAGVSQAKVVRVSLKSDFAHDVKAMAAVLNAGIIYVCNPNNPTGTITSKSDIKWLIENKPAGSVVLLDEAYIHLSDAESCIDLVKADKDLIILRTFSKVYGMAGIRCGFAIGRPDLLEKMQQYLVNPMPITAVAAATASLKDEALVPARKKVIADIRNEVFEWLDTNKYSYIPSQSNCFMIDTKRDGRSVFEAMAKKNVYIGRIWPVWPSHVRITVGTREEMAKFKTAFKEVMDSPATTATRGTSFADAVPFSYLG